ncbi:hypothetical protein ACFFJT_00370 [Dyella flava]|uniref:Uncharacterized protein n=1 Tax=Dyella flava TaxID=1920170 RepID=A0ABS2K0U2_9GAMM|nr:hypothetical protein [Dyella flava]MBM7124225.1 hypothetical protein [Dyella flava]
MVITKRRLIFFLNLVLLSCSTLLSRPASGGCPSYVEEFQNEWVYEGTLGNHYIRMALQYQAASGLLVGEYGYNHQPGVLQVSGTVSHDGNEVNLVETDDLGKVTGKLNLNFNVPSRPYIDRNHLQDYNCQFLSGTWEGVGVITSESIDLSRDISLPQTDEEDRKANEKTAYAVQAALLRSDKKAFAALLNYPFFHFYSARQDEKHVYSSPAEVERDYSQIASIPYVEVVRAVPHELGINQGISSFMGGYVWISHGKVIQICAGGCGNPYMTFH